MYYNEEYKVVGELIEDSIVRLGMVIDNAEDIINGCFDFSDKYTEYTKLINKAIEYAQEAMTLFEQIEDGHDEKFVKIEEGTGQLTYMPIQYMC